MGGTILVCFGVIVIAALLVVLLGHFHESRKTRKTIDKLFECAPQTTSDVVDFDSLSDLPPPVAQYFRRVLTNGQKLITTARLKQSGVLRINTKSDTWSSFTAEQIIVPSAIGFVWNATVATPFAMHVRVLDSYIHSVGAGRVSLLSAFPLASAAGEPELNSGALHRYLAEAVWCPTALLPQSGIVWSPIDDHSARATLTDRAITVSLEFRFNDVGEAIAIYSSGRFGRFDGTYKQVPWEGHFRNYRKQGDMHVPGYGEVGWYENNTLQLVWKGEISDVQYQF
jgi:hypothetical protein